MGTTPMMDQPSMRVRASGLTMNWSEFTKSALSTTTRQ